MSSIATRRLATVTGHLQSSSSKTDSNSNSIHAVATAAASKSDNDVVCVSAGRTALGGLAGTLSSLTVTELGAHAIRATLDRANITPETVQEVFFGNVLSAGVGQAPARQAALKAGLSVKTPCTTVNKVCASGMKALIFGAQSIQLGLNECVVVGGMESMSNAPYYLPGARSGYRMGHQKVVDGVIHDGLWDAYHQNHMGTCAEVCAQKYGITRAQQDAFAWESYSRAQAAVKAGHYKPEIIPIPVTVKGKTTVVQADEELSRAPASASVFEKLKPSFPTTPAIVNPILSQFDKPLAATVATTGGKPVGTVTAANASTISDGAAALVLMSRKKANALGLKPLFRVLSYADAATSVIDFPIAPSLAIPPALQRAGLSLSDIDLFELNEAFSVVALANGKILNLDPAKCNVWGGAVSIGHPIGCSGARIVVTLASQLQQLNKRYGLAAICNGGGGASAVIIERE